MSGSGEQSGDNDRASVVGVISDTHGLLRESVLKAFEGVDLIVHAGDIGGADVLERLRKIAPVEAVRGNMDGEWARMWGLRELEIAAIGGIRLLVIHDLGRLPTGWRKKKCAVVVSGHTHEPAQETLDGVLFVNPGSAGRQSSRHPPSVMLLHVDGTSLRAEMVPLD